MGICVGMKQNVKPEILESDTPPTKATHPQYEFIYGSFKTIEEAQKYIKAMGELACGEG